jgi:hypothetical protein
MRPIRILRGVLAIAWLTACGGRTDGELTDASTDASTDARTEAEGTDAPIEAASDAPLDTGDTGSVSDAADAPDADFACGSQTCAPGQLCQRNQIEGGVAVLPDDAGVCPAGTENVGGTCRRLPTYHCFAIPKACGATIDCACAGDFCLLISSCPYVCEGTSGRELHCLCAVP